MNILLRLFAALVLFLAVLAGGGLFLFSRYLDTASFRSQLVTRLGAALGREVALGGELDVTIYPFLGVEAWDVSLGNPPGFQDGPFAHVDHLALGLSLEALLDRLLDLRTVSLDGVQVRLVLLPDGHGNWEGWGPPETPAEAAAAAAAPPQEPLAGIPPMLIRGLAVSNAAVRFEDRASGEVFESSRMTLRTGQIVPGEPVAFSLESGLGWESMGLDARTLLSGKLRTDFAGESTALFEGASLQLDVTGGFLPKGGRAVLLADVDFDYKAGDLVLHDFRMKTLGLQLSGSVTARNLYMDPQVQGQLAIKPFNPRQFLEHNYPEAAPRRPGEALRQASFQAEVTGNRTSLALTNMSLTLDESVLRGDLTMQGFSKPEYSCALELNRLDVDRYAALWSAPEGGARPGTGGEKHEPALDLRFLPAAMFSAHWSGRLSVGSFRSSGLQWNDCLLEGAGSNGRTRLALKSSGILGGSLSGEMTVQALERQEKGAPAYQLGLVLNAAGLDVARLPFLPEQRTWALSGKGSASCSLQAPLKSLSKSVPLREALAAAKVEAALAVSGGVLALTSAGQTDRYAFSRAEARLQLAPAAQAPVGEGFLGVAELDLKLLRDTPKLQAEAQARGPLFLPKTGSFLLRDAALRLALAAPQPKSEELRAECSGQADLDGAAQTLTVRNANLQGLGQTLAGSLKATKLFASDPALSGHLEVQQADIRRLLRFLGVTPPAANDPAAYSKVAGSTDFQLSAKGVTCGNMRLRLDRTPVTGRFALTNFDAPRYEFQLQTGPLDLDRYLPPKGKKGEAPAQSGAARKKAPPEPLPLEGLRRLNLSGDLLCESLKVWGLTFTNLKVSGSADRGDIKVRPLTAGFYEGHLSGALNLKAESKSLTAGLTLDATGFQSGPFLIDAVSKEYLRGTTDFKLDLRGFGATDADLLRSLAGRMLLRIGQGSYRLFGLGSSNADKGKPQEQTARTNYDSLSASFNVQNGVFSTSDFAMKGSVVSATGKGQFSLAEESVDMNFNAVLVATPNVPIRVYGDLYNPSVALPPGKLLGNTVQDILGIPAKSLKILKDLVF